MNPALGVKSDLELFGDRYDGDGHEDSVGSIDKVGDGAEEDQHRPSTRRCSRCNRGWRNGARVHRGRWRDVQGCGGRGEEEEQEWKRRKWRRERWKEEMRRLEGWGVQGPIKESSSIVTSLFILVFVMSLLFILSISFNHSLDSLAKLSKKT